MRTLLTTTALVALFSMGAVAQDAAQPAPNANQPAATSSDLLTRGYNLVGTEGLASRLMGFPVYSSAANDADRIGEINDLVIAENGQVAAVIIGVGGFLGIGEKNVAVDYSQLEWTMAEDNTERLVLPMTKDALAAAADVNLDEYDAVRTAHVNVNNRTMDNRVVDTQTETGAIQQPGMTADPTTPGATRSPFDPTGFSTLDMATLTAEELIGTDVYGPNNEHIGPIGDLVLAQDGQSIDALIIDFGGFLGIGVKQVAVAFENLQFYTNEFGDRSLVLPLTREQMEAAPDFDRDSWAAQRDQQRVVVDGTAVVSSAS